VVTNQKLGRPDLLKLTERDCSWVACCVLQFVEKKEQQAKSAKEECKLELERAKETVNTIDSKLKVCWLSAAVCVLSALIIHVAALPLI